MRSLELSRANTWLNLKKRNKCIKKKQSIFFVNYDYYHPLHHKKQVVMEDVLGRDAGPDKSSRDRE